jgi:hypothetical protein
MVGRELSEARITLVEADMIDVGYRRDRLIDHLTSMAQDLYGIPCKVLPWLFLPIPPMPFVPHPYCLKFI